MLQLGAMIPAGGHHCPYLCAAKITRPTGFVIGYDYPECLLQCGAINVAVSQLFCGIALRVGRCGQSGWLQTVSDL